MVGTATYQGENPYLSVWDLISLGWLYFPVISLILISFSLFIAAQSADSGVEDAKKALLGACGAAEKGATMAANIPRYIAQATTEELNSAIHESLTATHAALDMALTAMESIIDYVIDSFNGIQLCFFQFVIRGSLSVLIEFTNLTKSFLGTVLNGIADGIQGAMNLATNGVNSIIDGINSIISDYNDIPFLPDISTISHISIPFDVSLIRNFNIPNTFQDELTSLNNSVPTLNQLRSDLQTLVSQPFTLVRTEMNTTFANIGLPNVTVPLPPVENITFCNEIDTGFIDDIGHDLVRLAYIGVAVLLSIAFIIFLINSLFVWLRWKLMMRQVDNVQSRLATIHEKRLEKGEPSGTGDANVATTSLTPVALLTLDNELTHTFAYKILDLIDRIPFLHLSPVAHNRLTWFLSYVFAPYPLICFLVGLFGILAICIQLIAVKSLEHKVDEEVNKVVHIVVTAITDKINGTLGPASATFASDVNSGLSDIDTALNGQLFTWITTSTSSVNNTIVAYYNDLQGGISSTFGGSLFANPISELMRCLVGSKIVALEGAVAYLQSHLHIPIPRVPSDILILSNKTLDEITSPIVDAAIGGGDGGIFGLLVNLYTEVLMGMLLIFGAILSIWALVCLLGLGFIAWDIYKNRRSVPLHNGSTSSLPDSAKHAHSATPPLKSSWWKHFSAIRALSPATVSTRDLEKEDRSAGHQVVSEPRRSYEGATVVSETASPTIAHQGDEISETPRL